MSRLKTMSTLRSLIALSCLALRIADHATAGAMLTQEAVDAGFGLTTFVSGFAARTDVGNAGSAGAGPLGVAFVGDGVIVSDINGRNQARGISVGRAPTVLFVPDELFLLVLLSDHCSRESPSTHFPADLLGRNWQENGGRKI